MNLCPNCFRELSAAGPCPACGYDGTGAEEKHPQALRPGSILNGRYIVGRVLGQGGFGITYLALDDQTKERVAIKEYYPSELAGRTTDGHTIAVHSVERTENFSYGKERFLEEAKTLANFLGNPYVVRILSYFEENGTGYFTMEYVEGPSLDKYMAPFGGRLGVEEAKHLLLPLMDAMDEVHQKGIVHRDVAPDNIIVTRDGRVKLIDFGAARYSTGEKSKSLDVILKHGFAPYEQYMRRGRQGPWTDVYAMAATFYYAITGKVPPDATERKDEDTLIPPSTLGVPIDDKTEEALLKALEVSAADRFQRMGDFAAALRDPQFVIWEYPPAPRPTPTPAPAPQPEAPVRPAAPAETVLAEAAEKKEAGKKKSRLPLILGVACAALLALVLVFARPGGKAVSPAMTPPPAEETAEPTPEPTATPEPEPESPQVFLFDEAAILDPEQHAAIAEQALSLYQRFSVPIYILTVDDHSLQSSNGIEAFAEEQYRDRDLASDGLLLVLSMTGRDYDIMSHGDRCEAVFPDYGKERLSASFLESFADDDWSEGISGFLSACSELLERAESGRPILPPWLGVTIITNYNDTDAQYHGTPLGAFVTNVTPGSCAEKAGIEADDIITRFDGVEIDSYEALRAAVQRRFAGDTIELEFYHAGESHAVTVTLDTAPSEG